MNVEPQLFLWNVWRWTSGSWFQVHIPGRVCLWFLAQTRTSVPAQNPPFESRSRCCDVSGRWPQRRRWKRPSGPQPPFSEMLPWSRIPWKRLTTELAFGMKLKEERCRGSSVFVWVTSGSQQAKTNPERTPLICVNPPFIYREHSRKRQLLLDSFWRGISGNRTSPGVFFFLQMQVNSRLSDVCSLRWR